MIEIVILVIVGAVILFHVLFGASVIKSTVDDEKLFRTPYDEYQAQATHESTVASDDPNYEIVTRVAEEWRNLKMTKKAILVRSFERGAVIHELRADGQFSKKGPYFISLKSGRANWVPIGTFHVVRTIRGKNGHGWKADHPYQDGTVAEVGIQILESDTPKRPPLEFRTFVERNRKKYEK